MILRLAAAAAAPLLANLLLAPATAAQTMDFACPEPGTVVTYDSGTRVTARGRDGFDCLMESADGNPYRVRALLFDNPAPGGGDISPFIAALRPERLWPLQVGRKIEADYRADGGTWHYVLGVARAEKRTGPGGKLVDTFLVEMNEQGPGGQRSISRWWIAPADRFAIRYDYSDGDGKANRAVVTAIGR